MTVVDQPTCTVAIRTLQEVLACTQWWLVFSVAWVRQNNVGENCVINILQSDIINMGKLLLFAAPPLMASEQTAKGFSAKK